MCKVWSAAAVAFRSLSLYKKTFLLVQCQFSSEVLWGRAVASQCERKDPRHCDYIADSMGDNVVALFAGTKLSRSDVRLMKKGDDEEVRI